MGMAKRTAVAIGILLGVTLAAGACRKKENAADHVRAANGYFDRSQYREAIVEYRRALQIDPRIGDARLKLGDAYSATNEPVNAIKEYIRAADLLPENIDAQ